MTNYIDAEKLKIELNKRIELLKNGDAHPEVMKRVEGVIQGYKATLSIIDSLQQEQPEVDLKKEIDNFFPESYFETAINYEDAVDIARHFYELGQQEMRHRITNPEYNAKVVEQLKSEYPIIKE